MKGSDTMEKAMRVATGVAVVLLMALQPQAARASEAFIAQVATTRASAGSVKSRADAASVSAMLASPLPLDALASSARAALAGGTGNFSEVAQSGSNNFAAVAQS